MEGIVYMMLDFTTQEMFTRHELINWLLFDELHGSHVVLELFEDQGDWLRPGQLILKPFKFIWNGKRHEHIFSEGDYSGVIRFDSRNPMVHINYINPRTHVYTSWSYPIRGFLPELADDGVVHLNLMHYPLFDKDKIAVLFNHMDDVKRDWMDGLRMEGHPFIHLDSLSNLTPLLCGLDVGDCFMLTQLGYLVDFELMRRERKD